MKLDFNGNNSRLLVLSIFYVLSFASLKAQTFQKVYGTPLDNSFSKVIQDGAFYYVLGQDEPSNGVPHRATVSRLDANGVHQWTLSMPTPSNWADAVLLPGGDLMVVGYSLPFDASTKSIIGRVTQGGTFSWLKSYDQSGRDFFNRVVEQSGSYYVLAGEIEPGGVLDNIALWNFSATGSLNWKKYYISSADDEFVRDLVAIPGGGLLMAGNDARGVIYTTDNNGEMTTTAVTISDRVYWDVEANTSGGFYAAATNFTVNEAYLQKFDAGLLLMWEVRINELNSIRQVWEGLPGELYVTGNGNFGNQLRTVIVKLTDDPNNGPSVSWVKYLHAGTGQTGGSAWLMPTLQLAFTDTRTLPGGFGQTCANISISDLEMSDACEVTTSNATLLFTDPIPDGPLTYFAETIPAPNPVNIIESFSLNWQEGVTCSNDPCVVELQVTHLNDCGLVQVCAISSGPGPYTYQWCDGSVSNCVTTQLPCGSHDFCVSVTCSDATTVAASTVVVVTDIVPPVALCEIGLTVALDATCTASVSVADVDQGSFDDCLLTSLTIDQGAFDHCGEFPVTLTVVDWCGNESSCTTIVMVTDNPPPNIMCPPDFSQECNGNIPPSLSGTATATDNCPVDITFTDNLISLFNPFTEGVCDDYIERTWKAADGCGNMSTCVQIIDIHDDIDPVISFCPPDINVIGVLNADGICTADVQVPAPTATDNCDQSLTYINDFNLTANASGVYSLGSTLVTWTVSDDCGNVETCVFTVTVACDSIEFPGFKCGQSVVTCYSEADPSGYVMGIMDTRKWATNAPLLQNWIPPMYHHPSWTATRMGEVFGITIAQNNDIYVAASRVYEGFNPPANGNIGSAGLAGIYRIDHLTGNVSDFITTNGNSAASCNGLVGGNQIPNDAVAGPGLGNLCYDPKHGVNGQFFVTNFEDGKIYRIDDGGLIGGPGIVKSCFDPFSPASSSAGFEGYREMLWGIGVLTDVSGVTKVYFGKYNNDGSNAGGAAINEIHSVMLDAAGEFIAGSQQFEISLPILNSIWYGQAMTNPISDIEFSQDGQKMLVAERSVYNFVPGSHASRVMEFSAVPGGWNPVPKIYYIGNFGYPEHGNAAGGVDYGYDRCDPTDPTKMIGCDSIMWATGDALRYDNIYVYGMAGVPTNAPNGPSPNGIDFSPLNNYYVDFNANVNDYNKTLIGDVDIFKCGCPEMGEMPACDSTLTATPVQVGHPDSCWYEIDLNILEQGICRMDFQVISSGVAFNQFQAGTWTITPDLLDPDGHIIVTHPPGDFPIGNYPAAIYLCLTNVSHPAPQLVMVQYFKTTPYGELLFCKDTLEFLCEPPDTSNGCWSTAIDSVFCNPDSQTYTVKMTVTNEGTAPFDYMLFYDVAPASCFSMLSPTIVPFSQPLQPDASEQVCMTFGTSKFISDTTNVYFKLSLFSDNECCHAATDSVCVPLPPCCDPCENVSVSVDSLVSEFDSCCYTMDVHNGCAKNYFKRIETVILTPGVTFSQALVVSTPPGWYTSYGVDTAIHWSHQSGFLPVGNFDNMMNFCLTDINDASQYPQCVEIKWIACDSLGNEIVACRDTLKFYCPPVKRDTCIEIVEQNITCLPNGDYQYNYTIKNISTHYASHFSMYAVLPSYSAANVSSPTFPFTQYVNLNPYDTWSGSLTLTSVAECDTICFKTRLFDLTPPLPGSSTSEIWCCFDTLCIIVPPCDTCVCQPNLTLSQGGVDYPVFCDPHVGSIPTLPCPADDVFVGGFMGCVNATTGELCEETEVLWELVGPDTTLGGTTTNFTQFIFPEDLVDEPGLYCLTVWTLCGDAVCPAGADTCVCKVTWIQEECPDTCSCPAPTVPGPNLVTNGDFSVTGPLTFPSSSGYNFTSSNTIEGEYFIGNAPASFNNGFEDCDDHTPTSDGNMMIVNGNSSFLTQVWCQTISITPNTNYSFNCWIASLTGASPANLLFSINGNTLGVGILADSTTCTWKKFCQLWNSGTATTAQICIVNNNLTAQGNDFALDDISFERCSSTPVDTCCTTLEAFCDRLDNNVVLSVDNDLCKAILTVNNLPSCDIIQWVDWGDGHQDPGPANGSMAMHTYNGSGTYSVCYLAIELDTTGLFCFEKLVCDTFTLDCSPCVDPPDSLIAWWPMNEQGGDIVVLDLAGNFGGIPYPGGSIGTPQGPDPIIGKVNGALQFSSPGNRHILVNDHPNINFGSGDFSIDAWVNTNMTTQTEPIIDKLGNTNNGYSLSIQGTSPYFLTLALGTGSSVQVFQGPSIQPGVWNFVAASVMSNQVDLYVGNSNANTLTHTSHASSPFNASNPSRPLLIGANPLNLHWNIAIDELEIFNQALDALTIDKLWKADSIGKCPPRTCLCNDLPDDTDIGYQVLHISDFAYFFQPLGLLDSCDQVAWTWGDGTESQSLGRQIIEHSFAENSSFNVCMNVERTEANGVNCTRAYCNDVITSNIIFSENTTIRLYPNPTTGTLILQTEGAISKEAQLQVLDLWGRRIQTEQLSAGQIRHEFSIAALPAGLYFVKVTTPEGELWIQKVIKQ